MATARCSLVPTGSGVRTVWHMRLGKEFREIISCKFNTVITLPNMEQKSLAQPFEQLASQHCRRISLCASDKIEYYARA